MTQDLVIYVVYIGYALAVLLAFGTILTWVERKQAAVMSDRIGANRAYVRLPFTQIKLVWIGLFHGVADGLKFLQKEDIFPEKADRWVFALAPVVVLISTFLLFVVVPVGPDLIVEDLDTGIFFALAVSSISVIGVLMAGWASANKYALLGGLRAAGQLIAYELPLLLAVVGVVIQAGTLSMQGIVVAQADGAIFGVDAIGGMADLIAFFMAPWPPEGTPVP